MRVLIVADDDHQKILRVVGTCGNCGNYDTCERLIHDEYYDEKESYCSSWCREGRGEND